MARYRPGADGPAGLLASDSSWFDDAPLFEPRTGDPVADENLARACTDLCAISRGIRQRRAALRRSQEAVATTAGVRRQTVAGIEDGSAWPDALTVARVAAALGIHLTAQPPA